MTLILYFTKATNNFFFNLNIWTRRYSITSSNNGNIQPIVVYENSHIYKAQILKDNQGKAAIYRWVNKVNGKSYIGSTVNLSVRLYKYYSLKHITERKTAIHNALLKYGFDKFKLEILEYCKEGINSIYREQYYFERLKPEYNILEEAGSSLGFKHREETLEFFKNERKVSVETRQNLSLAATGRVLTPLFLKKSGGASPDEDKKKLSGA